MALSAYPYNCSAQITYHVGVNEDGRDQTTTRSLTGIKTDETDENLYEVINTIIDLQEHPAIRILRLDRTEFEEE